MTTALIILLCLWILLLIGVPIAFCFVLVAIVMLWQLGIPLAAVPINLISGVDSFILLSVPLFLLMSNILLRGGVGKDLFSAMQSWVGHWKGGLGIATILSCALFSAICGSSVATSATIGNVAIGEMTSRGYQRRFVFGLLAAGGTLGILIPPSIPLIIYSSITEDSIVDLFLAGLIPGLLLTGLFIAYCFIHALFDKNAVSLKKASRQERLVSSFRALPSVLLALLIISGIYTGAFTPTEAAGVGTIAALIIVLCMKRLSWADFKLACMDSLRTTVTLFLIIVGAKLFSHAVALYDIPQEITATIVEVFSSPTGFLIVVGIIVLIMGLFLESVSLLMLMIPILLPALNAMGIDRIWFGILFAILIEFALITPPVGMNLFVIQAVGKGSLAEVSKGVIPFFFVMLLALILVYLFPVIAVGIL
ncbi:TRAP transporter large permease [Pseudomonas sp. F1_0610]|uniref:TRAP transporter large permease n=1 Tax=Pseudomonas sp. F1_0610 TaxID=3114284 RepID=UPI0039C3ACD2